ncbi:unnamed protein product [Prunus armeniaca]
MGEIMGVLSSFRQPDKSFVRLWNSLTKEKMEEMEELGLEIAEVSRVIDEAWSMHVVVASGEVVGVV